MFYDEKLLLDIRMNILDKFVDYFVIVESHFFHNGIKRDLQFNINDYPNFKDKIIYLVHNNQLEQIKKRSRVETDTSPLLSFCHSSKGRTKEEAGMAQRWVACENEMEQMDGWPTKFMVCVLLNQQIICS